jgi:hypothetical protein
VSSFEVKAEAASRCASRRSMQERVMSTHVECEPGINVPGYALELPI